jgi:hypothetical protein
VGNSFRSIFGSGTTSTAGNYGTFAITASNQLDLEVWAGAVFTTNTVFRDPSAWYHIVLAVDTTQATSSNRVKLYVNGVQITSFAVDSVSSYYTIDYDTAFNQNQQTTIGSLLPYAGLHLDAYMTEVNWIDGQQLTPSSFGETNAITGVWQPKKYTGTYGTNGFYLNFSDNSNNTAATIGKDSSGNGNNWTPNSISVTAGTTYDSMVDSPTVGATSSNYCTLNPLDKATSFTTADGNLSFTPANTSDLYSCRSTFQIPSTGKWIWEVTNTNSAYMITAGLLSGSTPTTGQQTVTCAGMTVGSIGTFFSTTQWMNTTTTWSVTNIGNGDTLVIAYDADAGKIWFGRVASGGTTVTFYNTSGTADPSTGTDPRASGIVAGGWFAGFGTYFTPSGASANFGQRPFTFTNTPTGFKALNTYNLPASTISNGANYMAATTYTGTGVTGRAVSNAVNGTSMQPDLVWVKSRSSGTYNELYDSVRGVSLRLFSNDTAAEADFSPYGVTAFSSGGFTVSDITSGGYGVNENAVSYIGWQWKGGGTGVSNTSGTITSTVSANPSAGFSVVKYNGNYNGSTGTGTVGHGLGVAPSMIIVKNRDLAIDWGVGHKSIGWTQAANLNLPSGFGTSAYFNATDPTPDVFSVGLSNVTNQNGSSMVAYCFAPVAGYSAIGSYIGNGVVDGPFIYTGFRPRWIMTKGNAGGLDWHITDTSRYPTNSSTSAGYLDANTSGTDGNFNTYDILSNGFKIRDNGGMVNTSSGTYIYMAFAENPLKFSLAR